MSGSCSNHTSSGDDDHQHGHSHEVEGRFWYRNETVVTGLSGILYLLGVLIHFGPGLDDIPVWTGTYLVLSVSDVLFLGALVVGSLYTARNGVNALLNLNMSIDFLISVALLGALVLGKYLDSDSLAFLYGVAELLEDYAMRPAETSLEDLLGQSQPFVGGSFLEMLAIGKRRYVFHMQYALFQDVLDVLFGCIVDPGNGEVRVENEDGNVGGINRFFDEVESRISGRRILRGRLVHSCSLSLSKNKSGSNVSLNTLNTANSTARSV